MDFRLTDEQEGVRRLVRDVVEKEVKPLAAHTDETGEFPWGPLRTMAGLGLLGLNIPEPYGGAGADHVSAAILVEEIGRGCGSTGLIVAAHLGLACGPLNKFGSEAQKQRFLVPLARGEAIGCLGLTEPGAGSDLAGGVRTFAEKQGDAWVINGSKMWLTNGAEAKTAILLCRTDRAGGSRSLSQIIVPTDTPGLSFGKPEKKMGLNGSHTYAVSIENVTVPLENVLGREGYGLHQTLEALDGGRVAIGALSVGLAQAAYEAAVAYAKERKTFGKAIAEHQAIQEKIANMATTIEAARWLVYRAAWLRDQGQPFTLIAAQAKLFATEIAEKVCFDAIQIHGGYGYSREYPVERIYRDNRLMAIGEGTSEIQRMVIARAVLA
ncbi:MAG TPA: acyl-CoA dehydrogenase family protein [Anaerolineae bacterium]|nr:acyl-CoA dehydrogenase family protein [Anaerolineae bacterium]HNU05721.1 acyl-CoA dehydrogenase family protein [Anaerolineae bacterium]